MTTVKMVSSVLIAWSLKMGVHIDQNSSCSIRVDGHRHISRCHIVITVDGHHGGGNRSSHITMSYCDKSICTSWWGQSLVTYHNGILSDTSL